MVAPEIQTHDGRSQKIPDQERRPRQGVENRLGKNQSRNTKPEQQDTETEVYVSLRQLKKFRGRSPMMQKVRPCTQV